MGFFNDQPAAPDAAAASGLRNSGANYPKNDVTKNFRQARRQARRAGAGPLTGVPVAGAGWQPGTAPGAAPGTAPATAPGAAPNPEMAQTEPAMMSPGMGQVRTADMQDSDGNGIDDRDENVGTPSPWTWPDRRPRVLGPWNTEPWRFRRRSGGKPMQPPMDGPGTWERPPERVGDPSLGGSAEERAADLDRFKGGLKWENERTKQMMENPGGGMTDVYVDTSTPDWMGDRRANDIRARLARRSGLVPREKPGGPGAMGGGLAPPFMPPPVDYRGIA